LLMMDNIASDAGRSPNAPTKERHAGTREAKGMASIHEIRNPRRWFLSLIALIAVVVVLAIPRGAAAHPLGNFTVNQYTRIEVANKSLRLVYVLDMAEIPAFQERQRIDTNSNGAVDDAEIATYLDSEVPTILDQLSLMVGNQGLALHAVSRELTFPEGQAGLSLLRMRLVLTPASDNLLTATNQPINFRDDFATDRLGWREIVVTHGAGVAVSGIETPPIDASNELRNYPTDLLKSPLDERGVGFGAMLADAPAAAGYDHFVNGNQVATGPATRPGGGATGAHFAALLNRSESTTLGLIVTLLAAMVWGAAHALSPGHGKTVVGAYLVGSRGTPRHAAFLGMTVTITHTAGVIALGMITLFASNYILPERLFPWISVFSGLTVIVLGLWTFRARMRGDAHHHHHHDHSHDHVHDHEHSHEDGHVHSHGGHTHTHLPPQQISWRSLLALGISGGLLPCPSALVVLLGSIALGKIGFGLALVVAFSLGLAITLTSLGLAFLYAGNVLNKRISDGGRIRFVFRYGPALGSLALTLAGAMIILRALEQTGLR
jgi:nickel/cobalt transporter (NicO) family protein